MLSLVIVVIMLPESQVTTNRPPIPPTEEASRHACAFRRRASSPPEFSGAVASDVLLAPCVEEVDDLVQDCSVAPKADGHCAWAVPAVVRSVDSVGACFCRRGFLKEACCRGYWATADSVPDGCLPPDLRLDVRSHPAGCWAGSRVDWVAHCLADYPGVPWSASRAFPEVLVLPGAVRLLRHLQGESAASPAARLVVLGVPQAPAVWRQTIPAEAVPQLLQ